jgi:hypothetical protein
MFKSKSFLKACLNKLLCLVGLIGLLIISMVVLDIVSYHAKYDGKQVAKVSANNIGPQQFLVLIQEPGKSPVAFEVYGDMWQLDLKLLTWHSGLSLLGLKPLYKLDRLSGRYHSIDDERKLRRSVHQLSSAYDDEEISTDSTPRWGVFNNWLFAYQWLPGVESLFGGSTYLPMSEGAEYSVFIYPRGLEAKAENEAAKIAIARWGQ